MYIIRAGADVDVMKRTLENGDGDHVVHGLMEERLHYPGMLN